MIGIMVPALCLTGCIHGTGGRGTPYCRLYGEAPTEKTVTVFVNFEPADEILRCAQSNISYQAKLLYAAILFIEQMGVAFDALNEMIQMFK